jgi:hypothetical protein
MAELGLAASGIGIASLALQVGDCIVRLKSFWGAVKDAPEEIRHLMEEIEMLTFVLGDQPKLADPAAPPTPEPASFTSSRCLQLCKKAMEILNAVLMEVEGGIAKRKKMGSVKAVLKRDVIEKMRERLVSAQGLLMLSNQIYLL